MTRPLYEHSIAELGALIRAGELTSVELTEDALERIAAIDGQLHAFVLVTGKRAREDARRADRELAIGTDRGAMHGIPYALKDNYATAGIRTSCNSKLMVEHVPSADAAVETRLKAAGGVLLGKLAMHELGLGGPSFELPFAPARNPWDLDRFTGASSTGAGAAVAAGLVRAALGSDTSGSIRGPACHCGTVGLKPTYGLVSRGGVFPLSYSLDHCGPLTWTVEDAAIVLQAIAGHDPLDPSSADVALPNFASRIGHDLRGLRIGYSRHLFADVEGTSPEVLSSIDAAAQTLAELGAIVEEVTLPDFALFDACGRVIMTAEAFAIHEQDLKTRPLAFGRYTYQRIVPGAALSAADLTQAFRLRRELATIVNSEILTRYDALVTATGLDRAPRFDDFPLDWPPSRSATAMQTIPFNVTGNPALALPAGFFVDGLPLGMQIVGRAFDEPTILQIGAAYEAAARLTAKRPAVAGAQSQPSF